MSELPQGTVIELVTAARTGDNQAVILTIGAGADVNGFDGDGRTALMYAAYQGHLEILVVLIAGGANLNLQAEAGFTALDYACKNGQLKAAQLLVEHGGQLAEKESVMMLACDEGFEDIVRLAIEQGADVNTVGEYGMTPLIQAAWRGYKGIVERLIENGADVNLKPGNLTALEMATNYDHEEVAELLRKNGATS